jgi:hypothetical protein
LEDAMMLSFFAVILFLIVYAPKSKTITEIHSREENATISKFLFHDFIVPGKPAPQGPFYYLEITKNNTPLYLSVNQDMYKKIKDSQNKEIIIQFNDYLLKNKTIEKDCLVQIQHEKNTFSFDTMVAMPKKPRFKQCMRLITKENYIKYSVNIAGHDMSHLIKEE